MKEAGDYRPGKCRVFPESVIVNTTFNARIDDALTHRHAGFLCCWLMILKIWKYGRQIDHTPV